MPLGTEVGLSSDDIVLNGDPAPPKTGHSLPIFGPYLLWPNHWMHQNTTWYGGRPQARRHCVRRGPSSYPAPRERGTAAPSFRPVSIVDTVVHLSCCWALVLN